MTNNKQQTAVEWYAKEHKKFREEPWKYVNRGGEEAILKQAKAMEKEQIKKAFESQKNCVEKYYEYAEDYYNETYNK